LIALLSVGLGTILRRGGAAMGALLGLLYAPMMALALPDGLRDTLETLSPMTAGLAIQRTVDRADSEPIGPWAGLGVTCIWAIVALAAAALTVTRRDA
jgi:ABC-2 type transport system permease protein